MKNKTSINSRTQTYHCGCKQLYARLEHKNVVSDGRSDSEAQSQNNIVESLTQAYQPNTKKSLAIEGKIAELINTLLTGGLSADTANESAEKYPSLENIKFLSVSSVNERSETCSHGVTEQWI